MAIDIPHFWLYLAELITPMLNDGGIPMGQLFRSAAARKIQSDLSLVYHIFDSWLLNHTQFWEVACDFVGSLALATVSKQNHFNIYSTAPCAGDMFERHLCPVSSHWEWNTLGLSWALSAGSSASMNCRIEVSRLIACHCAFREICKPLVPQGQAGTMLVRILKVLCKEMVSLR